jgi:hypothetical protein
MESLVSNVEALKNFPFPTFAKFMEARASGAAWLAVDRGFALKWTQPGGYASRSAQFLTTLFTWLPILAALGFLIWIFASKSWIMLVTLPLLLIGYMVYHPGLGSLLGPVRTFLVALTFVGLFYGLLSNQPKMLALCAALSLIWYGIRQSYSFSVRHLSRAASSNEELLCALWQDERLSVEMSNGDKYWRSFKVVSGEHISYA